MLNNYYVVAFVLFFVAGLTDYFDGFLARKYNASSQMGEILDPIADKILIIFLFFWACIEFI
jgi:phosphatidylglycerophosphate synthase